MVRQVIAVLVTINLAIFSVHAKDDFITLASTTSTENSGLFGHILPIFTTSTGIAVRVVARGTGQAIQLAQNGDADVLLVHHRESEESFINDGFGLERRDVMYNHFIVVGPFNDPASIEKVDSVTEAFALIAGARALFISRGDDSGTHLAELKIWRTAGVDFDTASGTWYRDVGSGMGTTLNIASASNAYCLSDTATWIAFKNKGPLNILVKGDESLLNQYGVIAVNPQRHPHVNWEGAKRFVNWLTSAEGQTAINTFKIADQQLFFANSTTDTR